MRPLISSSPTVASGLPCPPLTNVTKGLVYMEEKAKPNHLGLFAPGENGQWFAVLFGGLRGTESVWQEAHGHKTTIQKDS